MTGRTMLVEAKPLDEDHILGLRERIGTAQYDGIQLTWDHGFGVGAAVISMTAEFPDGTRVVEKIKIEPLLTAWAKEVIHEHDEKGT